MRVRPDGSGLELFADGTRNILEVAVSPLLDGFARDNTNDGGGWDVRLHHFSGLTQHGYPRWFKNFADEIIEPLADYGGSGCGAAWVDEPGVPVRWNNAPFTADWGTGWIYHHGLTERGATFTATQESFARLPRVTDLDVDANSALYAASWKGASFTWVGPEVGFIVRATPRATPRRRSRISGASATSNFTTAGIAGSSPATGGPAGAVAPAACGPGSGSVGEALGAGIERGGAVALPGGGPVHHCARISGRQSGPDLRLASRPPAGAVGAARPWGFPVRATPETRAAIRSMAASPDARTRRETALALARVGQESDAAAIVPLVADSDPVVSHTAVEALVRLRALRACL